MRALDDRSFSEPQQVARMVLLDDVEAIDDTLCTLLPVDDAAALGLRTGDRLAKKTEAAPAWWPSVLVLRPATAADAFHSVRPAHLGEGTVAGERCIALPACIGPTLHDVVTQLAAQDGAQTNDAALAEACALCVALVLHAGGADVLTRAVHFDLLRTRFVRVAPRPPPLSQGDVAEHVEEPIRALVARVLGAPLPSHIADVLLRPRQTERGLRSALERFGVHDAEPALHARIFATFASQCAALTRATGLVPGACASEPNPAVLWTSRHAAAPPAMDASTGVPKALPKRAHPSGDHSGYWREHLEWYVDAGLEEAGFVVVSDVAGHHDTNRRDLVLRARTPPPGWPDLVRAVCAPSPRPPAQTYAYRALFRDPHRIAHHVVTGLPLAHGPSLADLLAAVGPGQLDDDVARVFAFALGRIADGARFAHRPLRASFVVWDVAAEELCLDPVVGARVDWPTTHPDSPMRDEVREQRDHHEGVVMNEAHAFAQHVLSPHVRDARLIRQLVSAACAGWPSEVESARASLAPLAPLVRGMFESVLPAQLQRARDDVEQWRAGPALPWPSTPW
jgi:hypothetical protein